MHVGTRGHVLTFHYVDPVGQTQVIRLGRKYLSPLSFLADIVHSFNLSVFAIKMELRASCMMGKWHSTHQSSPPYSIQDPEAQEVTSRSVACNLCA